MLWRRFVLRFQDLAQLGAVHPSAQDEWPEAELIVARKAPGFDLGYRYIRLPSDYVDCSDFGFDLFIPDRVVLAASRKSYSPSLARPVKLDLVDDIVRPEHVRPDALAREFLRVESGNPFAQFGIANLRVLKDPTFSRHKVLDLAALVPIHGGFFDGICP